MQFDEKVLAALDVLTEAAENDFELFRICTLVRDLVAPPQAEQVDEKHQRFDGVTYSKSKNEHYERSCAIHIDVWRYYNGNVPEGYHIHHDDWNPGNNLPDNLVPLTPSEHMKIHHSGMRCECTCEQCGKEFLSAGNRYTSRFCSKECHTYWHNHHGKYQKTCEVCGKDFPSNKADARFCSKKCARSQYSAEHVKTKICPVCGKEFSTRLSFDKKTCSPECEKEFRYANKRITKTCPICGKTFTVPLSNVHKYKTCSRECGYKFREQKRQLKKDSVATEEAQPSQIC